MVTPKLKHVSITLDDVIESSYRLEAQVFNIEAMQAKKQLDECQWDIQTVGGPDGLAVAYHRPRFKRIYVEKSHYPIFQPSQITDIYPKPLLYISDKTDTDIDALRVKKGQILMTCSGTVGKCTIVSDTLDNQIFSHDLLRITANRFEDTGYLYAFFISKMGQLLLTTNNYGAVIQHIEPEHLDAVPIPVPPESMRDAVHQLIMDSFALREESNKLIDEAERLMIEALKLPPLEKLEEDLEFFVEDTPFQNFTVKLDLLNNRFEGSYHVPIVMAILDYLFDSGAEVTTIGDERVAKEIILPGRFKRIYVEEGEGVVFFGGKQLYELDPTNKKYLSLTQHSTRIASQLYLQKNMIAVTCSGTIAKVQIVPKHWENWTINQHVMRIIPASDSMPGYIYVWLNSEYGRVLITRHTYGSVVDEIDDSHLSAVEIPLIRDENLLLKINNLVLKANELRTHAYYMEQQAVEKIEQLVDNQ